MMGLSVWGTSQMRTHGDDIAEAFALLGVEPVWNAQSRRLEGVAAHSAGEAGPAADRRYPAHQRLLPRCISSPHRSLRSGGFAGDRQDEPLEQNFPRKHYLADLEKHQSLPAEEAEAQARYRMFGAKPGAYGAGFCL